MANDRLYIRCNECGELLFVGKHFGGAWDVRDSVKYFRCGSGFSSELVKPFGEILEDFLSEHLFNECCNRTDFSFIAQFDDDFPDNPKYFERR